MPVYQYANNSSTALSGSATAGDTSISVSSATGFPPQGKFTIIVDSEIMLVTGVSGTTWTVERGAEDTTAASHNNNATVTAILTVDSFLNANHFDLRAFGAKGDGVTDDTAAVQAAFDAACVAGGEVFVPVGTFMVDTIDTADGDGTKSLTVRGTGFDSVIKQTAGVTSSNVIFNHDNTLASLLVADLCIDGNSANTSGNSYGFRVQCDDAVFRNVMFRDTLQEGIYHTPATGALQSRMIVEGCIFNNCGRYGVAAENITGFSMTGCHAVDCGAGLVDIEPGASGESGYNVVIEGNTVLDTGTALTVAGAIQVYGVNGVLQSSTGRTVIANNVIAGCGGSGIQTGNLLQATITGNNVYGAARHGICNLVGGGTLESLALTITGNTVHNASSSGAGLYSGIYLAEVRESIIANNVIKDTAAKHQYHLQLVSTCNQNAIGLNNYVGTAVTAQQTIGGASNLDLTSYND